MSHVVFLIECVCVRPNQFLVVRILKVVHAVEAALDDPDVALCRVCLALGGTCVALGALFLLIAMLLPINDGILDKGLEDRQENVAVVTESGHGRYHAASKGSVGTNGTECVEHVGRETEGNNFGFGKKQGLVKNTVRCGKRKNQMKEEERVR